MSIEYTFGGLGYAANIMRPDGSSWGIITASLKSRMLVLVDAVVRGHGLELKRIVDKTLS